MKVSTPTSSKAITTGSATPTGTATTVFTVSHGLGSTPSFAAVSPKNVLTAALCHVTWDSTNITLTFLVALTGSLSFSWVAVS